MHGRKGVILLLQQHNPLFVNCQLIAILCRFDNQPSATTMGMTASWEQDFALEFGHQGAVTVLQFEAERVVMEPMVDMNVLAALLSA